MKIAITILSLAVTTFFTWLSLQPKDRLDRMGVRI